MIALRRRIRNCRCSGAPVNASHNRCLKPFTMVSSRTCVAAPTSCKPHLYDKVGVPLHQAAARQHIALLRRCIILDILGPADKASRPGQTECPDSFECLGYRTNIPSSLAADENPSVHLALVTDEPAGVRVFVSGRALSATVSFHVRS